MSKNKLFFFLFYLKIVFSLQNCEEGKNFCIKCDYRTKLCAKCDRSILVPDENGGCQSAKKCYSGRNYCLNCDDDGELCKVCEEGYIPDENGGCANTNNCEISEQGICIKCLENFILIGENTQNMVWCKSKNSEDFKNCQKIDLKSGKCEKCEENYFLNKGDHRCIDIEN